MSEFGGQKRETLTIKMAFGMAFLPAALVGLIFPVQQKIKKYWFRLVNASITYIGSLSVESATQGLRPRSASTHPK